MEYKRTTRRNWNTLTYFYISIVWMVLWAWSIWSRVAWHCGLARSFFIQRSATTNHRIFSCYFFLLFSLFCTDFSAHDSWQSIWKWCVHASSIWIWAVKPTDILATQSEWSYIFTYIGEEKKWGKDQYDMKFAEKKQKYKHTHTPTYWAVYRPDLI